MFKFINKLSIKQKTCLFTILLSIATWAVIVFDEYVGNDFLENFIKNDMLSMMGIILAIYAGVVCAVFASNKKAYSQLTNKLRIMILLFIAQFAFLIVMDISKLSGRLIPFIMFCFYLYMLQQLPDDIMDDDKKADNK